MGCFPRLAAGQSAQGTGDLRLASRDAAARRQPSGAVCTGSVIIAND
jgi:hypothetical protein